jgi:hypothetical protein
VNTTPKLSAAAVNVNTRYPGQLNPSEMPSITAEIDAINVGIKQASTDALTGLPALWYFPTITFFMNHPLMDSELGSESSKDLQPPIPIFCSSPIQTWLTPVPR